MTCEVAVFHFRGGCCFLCATPCEFHDEAAGEPNEFGVLSIKLDLVATVEIEAAGFSPKEVAVRAWIAAVGRHQWDWLVERVNPPPILVNSYVNPELRWHDDRLREAPEPLRHLGGSYQFIYDNLCESWLLQLESEWTPGRLPSGRARQFPVAAPANGHAALGSLWTPQLN